MSTTAKRRRTIAVAAGAAIAVALLGGTATDIGPWYFSLQQPSWAPPPWAYGPIWTLIFALAAASAATAWLRSQDRDARSTIVGLFALNGFLNILWSILFFQIKRPDWALIESIAFWFSILVLMIYLWPRSRLASGLLAPYLIWVTLATILNYQVVQLNPQFS